MAWYDDPKQTVTVKEYSSNGAMQRDMRKAAEHGWEVASTTSKVNRQKWKLILALVMYWLWTTTAYVVTFKRVTQGAAPPAD